MDPTIKQTEIIPELASVLYIVNEKTSLDQLNFNLKEQNFINKLLEQKVNFMEINRFDQQIYLHFITSDKSQNQNRENARKNACKLQSSLNSYKTLEIFLVDTIDNTDLALVFAEGLALSSYQFIKYLKDAENKEYKLQTIYLVGKVYNTQLLNEINTLIKSVYNAKDQINEPSSYMNCKHFTEEITRIASVSEFKVEILDNDKIDELKMGGLLAVNKGSIDPPFFAILIHKPENAVNVKPVILIGKGIIYDTGGLSLKPTKDSMDYMKSDMAGASAVIGCISALSKNKQPVYVIGLIPITDNRISATAYSPGDIIKMYDGTTVEVMNCDAEGRLILADALSYAKKYEPEIVIDLATLTGAAAVAIGTQAAVSFSTLDDKNNSLLKSCGDETYERIVEFPLWEEYESSLKSDIADIRNIGTGYAGAITAAKFLQKFIDYPWVHLDIAGPAFIQTEDSYRGKGATGYGIRLLYHFIKQYYKI